MEILFVLIPLSVVLIAFALWSFVWSVKNDQFEDLDRQGWSILFDEQNSEASQESPDDAGGDVEPGSGSEDKQP